MFSAVPHLRTACPETADRPMRHVPDPARQPDRPIRVAILSIAPALRSSIAIALDAIEIANTLSMEQGAALYEGVLVDPCTVPDRSTDLVIVPSLGMLADQRIIDYIRSPESQDACDWIRLAADCGNVAACCSGVLLLAQAGVLDHRRATTSAMAAPLLSEHFPHVRLDPSQTVVQDRRVTTGGAPLAQIDVMLSLIGRSGGAALADACGRRLLSDGPGGSHYTPLGFYTCRDAVIAQAEAWVRERLDRPICVEEMASDLGFSPRTLARRMDRTLGLTPIRFVQRLRLDSAVHLLRRTRLPVDEIARRVGYAEASTLRRVMTREMSLTPAELRASGLPGTNGSVKSAVAFV